MRSGSRSVAWERTIAQATLLAISMLAAAPLWGPGLLNTRGGGDSPFLLLRTHQLLINLRAGIFPARWMPDAAYGFGYPFFSYYAALPYYVAAGFELLGVDILTAIKLTQTLFLAAAALAMFRWAEELLGSRAGGLLAGIAYTSAPFHLVNLYVRGDSLSEFAAFAFYPLILWGFDRLASRPSIKRALLPTLAYAALIVTHNISALIFSPFLILYMLIHLAHARLPRINSAQATAVQRSLLLAAPVFVAFLLSSWFWLPALTETHHVQLSAQTTGYFFYGNHFRGADLVQPALLFDYRMGQKGTSPFATGLVQAILALVGASITVIGWARPRLLARDGASSEAGHSLHGEHPPDWRLGFGLFGLLVSTWLMTSLSSPLWDRLPLLPMVQFPWRFLSLQALFAALLAGAATSYAHAQKRIVGWGFAIILGALSVASGLASLEPEYLPITELDVTVERLQLYELFTGNIGSTIRHEYLPKWVNPRPRTGPSQISPDMSPRATAISGEILEAERLLRKPTRRTWRVKAGAEGSRVAFPVYYWPGWYAVVDGTRVEVKPAAGSGYLSLEVPEGEHEVELRLGNTLVRSLAEAASLTTALAMVAIAARAWLREARTGDSGPRSRRLRHSRRRVAIASYLPVAILLTLAIVFHPRVDAEAADVLTMDFQTMPYLHRNPDGLTVDGWQITSYSYAGLVAGSGDTVAPGGTLRVLLEGKQGPVSTIDEDPDEPVKLQLVSPAAVRQDEIPPVADAPIDTNEGESLSAGTFTKTVMLPIPERTAPGIHLLQISSSPPVYLRPVWIAQEPAVAVEEEPIRAVFAEGALRLHSIQVQQPDPDRLDVRLSWSAASPSAANYGLRLSLTDQAGNEWLRQGNEAGYNTQPGLGFLPTSLWPLDRVFDDPHVPDVQEGIPPGESYQLTLTLYDVPSWKSVGQYTQTVTATKTWTREDAPVVDRLAQDLVLSKLEAPQRVWQGQPLHATAYWWAPERPAEDYVIRWQLEGAAETISSTQPLASGSSPREWPAGAWIAGRVALPIPPTTLPGEYKLSLALREAPGQATLDSYTHPTPVHIRERDRVWELPTMDNDLGAQFGDAIELTGYDLERDQRSLRVTLYWRAFATPDRDYMFFVHLADPETGEPASQVDGMPRGFTYPTGEWAPGEVVSDVVEVPTEDVAAGPYVLAVGWYDPDTDQRLPAVGSRGERLEDDRVVLPSDIILP